MKKLIIIAHSSTLILLTALGGCENIQPPQCRYSLMISYVNGEIDSAIYQDDCNVKIYQYHDEIKFNLSTAEYNTIRFKLISKTVLKK